MIDYDEEELESVKQKCTKARDLMLDLGKWSQKRPRPWLWKDLHCPYTYKPTLLQSKQHSTEQTGKQCAKMKLKLSKD